MAGFIALGGDKWIGTLALSGGDLENGAFVKPNYATGVATIPASNADGDGDVLFVENENDNIYEDLIDTANFKVKAGKQLKAHVPQKGEIFVTTMFVGTPANGAVLAVATNGKLDAIGVRTPKFSFSVKDNAVTYMGLPAIKVIVE